MPSSSATNTNLDLEAWADLIPKERNNDFEYNLLVYRFKTFFEEVKDFHGLHSNCSVTLANNGDNNPLAAKLSAHDIVESVPQATSVSIRSKIEANNQQHVTGNSHDEVANDRAGIRSQHVINLKKKFSQNQDSTVSASPPHQQQPLPSAFKSNIALQTKRLQNPVPRSHQDNHVEQFNSSHHNLVSLNLNSANSYIGLNDQPSSIKPVVKQRSQSGSNSRLLLLSKSSERLDNINNNLPVGSSLEHDLGSVSFPISNRPYRSTMSRDSRYLQDDDNIYDAVSSDDHLAKPKTTPPNHQAQTTTSINLSHDSSGGQGKASLKRIANNLIMNNRSSPIGGTSRVSLIPNKTSPPTIPSLAIRSSLSEASTQDQGNNNHRSSSTPKVHDTSSSQSLVPQNMQNFDYGNYVNIDFFLKRTQSPPPNGLGDELSSDDSSDDEDPTQLSTSLSNDRLCDDSFKDLSPRELARKLASNSEHNNSSNSLTPASSSDFLDDSTKNTMSFQISTTSSFTSKRLEGDDKYNSFFSSRNRRMMIDADDDATNGLSQARGGSSTTPRESTGSRISLSQHQKALEMIQENQIQISSNSSGSNNNNKQQALSRESSQLYSENNSSFAEAHSSMRSFLSDLNLSPVDDVFEDKAQRRIVKESFAVEFCGRRKLRHLFLFNDVIVCAKYQASSKQKFTFDVKWYLNLNGVTVSDVNDASSQVKLERETIENQILAIRTNLMLLRGQMQQIKRTKDKRPSKIIKKLKKKRTELEAELVLLLPHLPLVIKHVNGKKYLFFLSSNFDRNQWIESIKYLQSQLPLSRLSSSSPSSSELQAWIQTCRKNLNPSLGTFLLRSNCDDDLLYGDLLVKLSSINGLPKTGHYYFCFEVDSYGHFSQKASSVVLSINNTDHDLNEEYVLPLDGAHTLRILLYEDLGQNLKPSVIGKAHIELSRSWFFDNPVEKVLEFSSNCRSFVQLSYTDLELLSMKIQHAKLCPAFGIDITQVSKKEKTNVPMLIQMCVNEVERRGMREVGIYRMSGTSTDVQRLKKAFETNPYVAELLLRDIDINSVTGFLKTYLREMPEGLFINKLYLKFVAAFNIPQSNSIERTKKMLELFHKIPAANQHTIIYMVEHLVKVNKYEMMNKMSLTNLATVLGPNILRPPTDTSNADSSDPFTAVVIGSMSQAGILYFFLNRRASNLPLTELDPSELARSAASEA